MDFFSKMLSGDSTVSYGRFSSFLVLVCVLIWVSLAVAKGGAIPALHESWIFLICIPFGITKMGDIATSKKGADNASPGQAG